LLRLFCFKGIVFALSVQSPPARQTPPPGCDHRDEASKDIPNVSLDRAFADDERLGDFSAGYTASSGML
jgi:hypothetical protein